MSDDVKLKIKIMPHKENKTAAVFIEGFSSQLQAKRFCLKLLNIEGISFEEFLNKANDGKTK